MTTNTTSELTAFSATDSSCLNCPYAQLTITGSFTYSAGQYPTNLTIADSAGLIQVIEAVFVHSVCQVEHCSHCSSSVDCTSCLEPYYLQLSSCKSSCDVGFYLFSRTCYLTCPDGTYTVSANYSCTNCVSPCKTCQNATSCLSCVSSYFLEGNKCLSSCSNSSLYPNSTTSVCETCPNPCVTCQLVNNSIECLTCAEGYLFSGGSCRYICPWGYYGTHLNGTSQCLSCSS